MQAREIENRLKNVQIDFMDIAHDIYQRESENKKKLKSQRKAIARRAIEMHLEKRKLTAEIREYWED